MFQEDWDMYFAIICMVLGFICTILIVTAIIAWILYGILFMLGILCSFKVIWLIIVSIVGIWLSLGFIKDNLWRN